MEGLSFGVAMPSDDERRKGGGVGAGGAEGSPSGLASLPAPVARGRAGRAADDQANSAMESVRRWER